MNSASSVLLTDVLTPTDEGFDSDPIYNATCPRCPTLKLCATGTADLVDAGVPVFTQRR